MKKTLINYMGLLGIVSLLSYTAAVLFAPRAYPGYDWMAQAVSDLSAESAPSRLLWNRLAAPYNACGLLCVMMACVYLSERKAGNRALRLGVYLFAAMNWVSALGYAMFPLSEAGGSASFQNAMHLAVTASVVALSILSLAVIIAGGLHKRTCPPLAACAAAALGLMMAGAIGVNAVPPRYFGIPERFCVFAAAGFQAALGVYLFRAGNKNKAEIDAGSG